MLKKVNFLWSLFSSIKLTIILLSLIIVLFVVATLIPQQEGSSQFIRLKDIYHSHIFYALMSLLSLNLIICSLNRLPVAVTQYKAPHFPPPQGLFENLPADRMLLTNKKIEDISRAVESSLASPFASVTKSDSEKERLFFQEKGRFSLFGVYIVHLGVLTIMAGAVIGSIFGVDADINLSEGQESNIIQLSKDNETRELDFSVRCDKFILEYYENGTPKTYRSDLSFIKDGRIVHQGAVLVNHPLTFEGFRFYQSRYGLSEEAKAVLTYRIAGRESPEIVAAGGQPFDLPGHQAKASVLRMEGNLMDMGPAVKLNIETGKDNIQFWVFHNIEYIKDTNPGLFSAVPLFNPGLFKPLVFSLKRIEKQYYTGLQIVRDPGIPLVMIGAIMLVGGLISIYFISHQRIWIWVKQEPEGVQISLAGRSSRNHEILQRRLDGLSTRIRKEIDR